MIVDYVSSGVSSLKIFGKKKKALENPNHQACLNMIRSLSSDHYKFSVLFNAFTERNLGMTIHDNFKDVVYSIHADSGGLQMITKGMTITDKEKNDIYDFQAKYSDIGMCFDEIPIVTDGGKVEITNMNKRYFDYTLVKEKALETAQNVKNQIKWYKDNGSDCRPMLILQGNCIDSIQEWVNVICDYLGDDVGYIHGISLAGTSLGGGHLEDIVRTAAAVLVDYPKELNTKYVHFLGVGAPVRLASLNVFKDRIEDKHISFDSTTHSHAVFKGAFIFDGSTHSWAKLTLHKKEEHINRINELFGQYLTKPITYQDLKMVYDGSLKHQEKHNVLGANDPWFVEAVVALFSYMIHNNLEWTDKIIHDQHIFDKITHERGGVGFYNKLRECRDVQDFNDWYKKYAIHFNSNRVRNSYDKAASFDMFF